MNTKELLKRKKMYKNNKDNKENCLKFSKQEKGNKISITLLIVITEITEIFKTRNRNFLAMPSSTVNEETHSKNTTEDVIKEKP